MKSLLKPVAVGVMVVVLLAVGAGLHILVGKIKKSMTLRAQWACMSNLRQLNMALGIYRNDYDGYHPLGFNWADALYPNFNNPDIFLCPRDRSPSQCGSWKVSYAYNLIYEGTSEADWPVWGTKTPPIFIEATKPTVVIEETDPRTLPPEVVDAFARHKKIFGITFQGYIQSY